MSPAIAESDLETAALAWFQNLGYETIYGPTIDPGEPAAERDDFEHVILRARLEDALARLNPKLPREARDEARRQVLLQDNPVLIQNNRRFHELLANGVEVEYRNGAGRIVGDRAWLVDFANPDRNDWLVVNQFSVKQGQVVRRPDVVVFVNGLPLAILELKNPGKEAADVWNAFQQLQTYRSQLTALFGYNEVLVASDGIEARIGSLSSTRERFAPWKTVEGTGEAHRLAQPLEVLIRGVFDRRWFLDLLKHFIVFEDDGGTVIKKLAGYHQFHAVRTGIEATVRAVAPKGDRRIGVIWHTQGSGKSLTMVFYAGKLVIQPELENPTLVVLTDRNDLDEQLFGTFSRCSDLLRNTPKQADSRAHLRSLLQVASGGIVFTTIQKFFPETKGDQHPLLSDRRNIVVIADEAHRSQYDFIDGFARHMRDALPRASFIGFTGTPIEQEDANTRAVFGDYISVYDIQQAVEDGATVPIYYEGRLAKLGLDAKEQPRIDPSFEEVTEDEEVTRKERLKSKWAQLEAVVGAQKRVDLIAADLVEHFEHRLEVMDGKAMVVCMSRRICVALYDAILRLRPQWASADDDRGQIKIVMTGAASDSEDWQQHIRNKPRREAIARRFKNPADPLKLVLVRDMWLTGFDVPCLHTMYLDKPMQSHGLMQAIARVNRVFRDKPGGLVVDYLGLADSLRKALAVYTSGGGGGEPAIDQEKAVEAMLERYEICRDLFHGFDYTPLLSGTPVAKVQLLPRALDHLLAEPGRRDRFVEAVLALSKAFALAVPRPEALEIRDEVALFQGLKAAVTKRTVGPGKPQDDLDYAIRQIVSRAIAADAVVDIFEAAGLRRPDISILSDEFLAEVQGLPHRNLAVELLRRLLENEIKLHRKTNLIQSRSFAEMLERAVQGYLNRSIETVKVIEELIRLAKEIREAHARGGQAWPQRGRTRVLRCAGSERQRREGPW
jgi:type I restriction enzyme R subunit